MKTNRPILIITALLVLIGALFLLENQSRKENRREELTLQVKALQRRNDELHEQIELLQDEVDACQHDLQDCFRRHKDTNITERNHY